MPINEGMFTSNSSDYLTPKWLLEHLYEVFTFYLDPCSDQDWRDNPNVDAFIHYTAKGLERPWTGTVFMNPPYGREIRKWFAKAANCNAKTVVCLIPARTDTRWFQDHIKEASCIVFIKGRLKFSNAKNSAPFPSAIVVFGKTNADQREHLAKLGWEATS